MKITLLELTEAVNYGVCHDLMWFFIYPQLLCWNP